MTQAEQNTTEERIWWLRRLFRRENRETQVLYKKAGDLGPPETMKPSVFRRFARMMDQISFMRKKEADILQEIASLEEKHKELRREKKLKKADPDLLEKMSREPRDRNDQTLSWAAALWLFMSGRSRPKPAEPAKKPDIG